MTYPVLFLRIKAMFLDSLVFGLLLYGMIFLTLAIDIQNHAVRTIFIVLTLVLFEPILIWLTGGSLGHHYAGIRVVSKKANKNLFVINGVVRLFAKAILGVFSLLFMLLTRQHQAFHDLVSGSVVIFKDESKALERHKLTARPITYTDKKPSILRRTLVVFIYSFLTFIVYSFGVVLLVSSRCLNVGYCTEKENLVLSATGLVFIVSVVVLVILGFMCKLPGVLFQKVTE